MTREIATRAAGDASQRKLTMKYAGGLVRHLGLQMYGGFVPAIAELVANAWDADATRVDITVPLDTPLTEKSYVRVQDNGSGMGFDEVNTAYLVLGRDRRRATGKAYTTSGRRVMGRKGIGKLAGFGIAHLMRVTTVRDGWLTDFEMDYEDILAQAGENLVREYEPDIRADRAVEDGEDLEVGTTVTLTRLQVQRAMNGDQFRRSMARRFSIFGDQFKVFVNGEPLAHQELAFQFRFPGEGWEEAQVEGLGQIRWWTGFTEKPIPHEDARGIAVLARGKLVQRPFFFDLSGGTQGQHGMQYLTGEVVADALDDAKDLVATDRATVLWEDSAAQPLLAWGQQHVRRLLREWSKGRAEANVERVRRKVPELARLDRLPERAQVELRKAVSAISQIDTIDEDRLHELVTFLVRAYDNEQFMSLVRELNTADPSVGDHLVRLFQEWDVQEAVNLAWIVRGRIEIIQRFGQMIADRAPEKPDMQDFVKEHPWLLGPSFDPMRHEVSLDRLIREELDIEPTLAEDGSRRLDFFTLADSAVAVVVELKRPGQALTRDDIRQLEDYVNALRTHYSQITDLEAKKRVKGVLVGARLKPADNDYFTNAEKNEMVTRTWRALLEETERLHREYLDVVRERAPQDDPRIDNLGSSVAGRSGAEGADADDTASDDGA